MDRTAQNQISKIEWNNAPRKKNKNKLDIYETSNAAILFEWTLYFDDWPSTYYSKIFTLANRLSTKVSLKWEKCSTYLLFSFGFLLVDRVGVTESVQEWSFFFLYESENMSQTNSL